MELKETITHPITMLSGGALAVFGDLGQLADLLVATSDLWYPLLAGLLQLGRLLPAIPTGLVEDLFLAGLVVYVSIQATRLFGSLYENYTDDS